MKIVINDCYGGFGLSDAAYEKLIEWGAGVEKYNELQLNRDEVIFDRTLDSNYKKSTILGRYWDTWFRKNRQHPLLIRVVEELGKSASGRFSALKVVEIPDDVKYIIEEYDGMEHIAEVHRTWN